MRFNRSLSAALCVICIGWPASAQSLSLPLAGFYRTGRYMPVKIDVAGKFNIQASGVMPTTGKVVANTVVPILIIGLPGELPGVVQKLHPLGDQDRLIGSTIDQSSTQNSLTIKLDPANPLPGAAVAWECLDRLILDADSFQRIRAETIAVLLAAGCRIEVIAKESPSGGYQWKKQNARWILDCEPDGPIGQMASEAAFAPTLAWAPGKPVAFLHQAFLAGVVLSIAVLSLLLWRSRVSFAAMLIVISAASTAIFFWKEKLPGTDDITGSIVICRGQVVQTDNWLYEHGTAHGLRRIPWNGLTHPMVDSMRRFDELKMMLEITEEGRFAFVYQSMPNQTVAFMHRRIEMGGEIQAIKIAHDSPMQELAKDQYLKHGASIRGEAKRPGEIWPAVVIDAASR